MLRMMAVEGDQPSKGSPALVLDGMVHEGIWAGCSVEFRLGDDVTPGWYRIRWIGEQSSPARLHASFSFGDGYRWSQGGDSSSRRMQRPLGDLWMVRRSLRGIRLESLDQPLPRRMRLEFKRVGRLSALLTLVGELVLSGRVPGLRALWQALRAKGAHGLADSFYRFRHGEPWSPSLRYAERIRDEDSVVPAVTPCGTSPRFSILLPTHNTEPKALRRCLESVLAQDYEDWELCVCDDASTRADVWTILSEQASRDPRIILSRLEQGAHISGATNHALTLARGDYVLLLDHDDELHPRALSCLAQALARNPHWDLVYTDEDKLGLDGRRFDPCFKPDFNVDLLRGQNCVGHLGAYRRELIVRLGGLRTGFEGSQDWDLALRVADSSSADRIGHIPHVLYHWRISGASTALSTDAKPYARDAAKRAIGEHLQRNSIVAEVHELAGLPGRYRILFPLPADRTQVSIVVFGNGDVGALRATLLAVPLAGARFDTDLRVVCRSPEERQMVLTTLGAGAEDRVLELSQAWSDVANRIRRESHAEFIVMLQAGLVGCADDWLEELVRQAARGEAALVSPKVYDAVGRIWSCGVIPQSGGTFRHAYQGMRAQFAGMAEGALLVRNVTVVADCIAFRREHPGLQEGFTSGLSQQSACADLSLRAAANGFLNVWTPFAEMRFVTDQEGDPLPDQERDYLHLRWPDAFRSDAWERGERFAVAR